MMKRLAVLTLLIACVPPQAPFHPVSVTLDGDGYARALRGVVSAGYEVDTKDDAGGIITTTWQDKHVTMQIWTRYRWVVTVSPGNLRVESQCQTQERDGDWGSKRAVPKTEWSPCPQQGAERNDQAKALAKAIVSQPKSNGETTKPVANNDSAARGFYCRGEFCWKDKTACEQPVPGADPVACALTELAYCFATASGTPACATTMDACQQRQTSAGGVAASDCVEAK